MVPESALRQGKRGRLAQHRSVHQRKRRTLVSTTRINRYDAMRNFPEAMRRLLEQVVEEDPSLHEFEHDIDWVLHIITDQEGACFGLRGTEAGIAFVAWQKDEPDRVVMYNEQSREWVAFRS